MYWCLKIVTLFFPLIKWEMVLQLFLKYLVRSMIFLGGRGVVQASGIYVFTSIGLQNNAFYKCRHQLECYGQKSNIIQCLSYSLFGIHIWDLQNCIFSILLSLYDCAKVVLTCQNILKKLHSCMVELSSLLDDLIQWLLSVIGRFGKPSLWFDSQSTD